MKAIYSGGLAILLAFAQSTAQAEPCTRDLTPSASTEVAQFYYGLLHTWPSVYYDMEAHKMSLDYAFPRVSDALELSAAAFMAEPGNPPYRKLVLDILDFMIGPEREQSSEMARQTALLKEYRAYVATCSVPARQTTALEGVWTGPCVAHSYGNDLGWPEERVLRWSTREELKVTGHRYSLKERGYDKRQDCSGVPESTHELPGTVHLGQADSQGVTSADWIEVQPGYEWHFSISKIDGDRLFRGVTSGDRNGSTPELRHVTLVDPTSPLVLKRTR